MSWLSFAKELVSPITDLISEGIEDKDKANALIAKINQRVLQMDESIMNARAGIIMAEAKGESWLQRNWRPLTMCFFSVLIGMHWFGMTPENLTEGERIELMQLIKFGLGGYIVGRSGEKIAAKVAPALANATLAKKGF